MGLDPHFEIWAGETTSFPREVIEAALAHGIKNKAEAAYARSDLFDKRRDLMTAWAQKVKCSGQYRQCAKMYPTRQTGYENHETT